MNFTRLKKLPSIEEIIQSYPLSTESHKAIMQDREEIQNILSGKDSRLLLILGPCSAWPKEAVLTYAKKLKAIEERVCSSLKLVMRLYIQKPRTTKGWTGPLNQPDPFGKPDIEAGMHYVREMMVKVVEMGLPIADECLFTHNARGFSELVSWFAIGARSSEDHEHRIFASAANCPVGLKNPTHGSLSVAVNSVIAAQSPHITTFEGYEVQSFGNPFAHLVLRGGNQQPNYSIKHLEDVKNLMLKAQLKHPALLIDVSHDNCLRQGKKEHRVQSEIVFSVLGSLKDHPELRALMKGFMLESYLLEGKQVLEHCSKEQVNLNGLSITDPCLGWDDTEALLLDLAERVGDGL